MCLHPKPTAPTYLLVEEAASTAPAEAVLQPRHQLLQLLIVLLLCPLAVQLLAKAAVPGGLLGGTNQAGLQQTWQVGTGAAGMLGSALVCTSASSSGSKQPGQLPQEILLAGLGARIVLTNAAAAAAGLSPPPCPAPTSSPWSSRSSLSSSLCPPPSSSSLHVQVAQGQPWLGSLARHIKCMRRTRMLSGKHLCARHT